MGQSPSVTVEETRVPGNKLMVVTTGNARATVPFSEETDEFSDDSRREVLPRFCLSGDMHPSYCGRYLSPEMRKRYLMAHGPPCKSFAFRPGSLITDATHIPPELRGYVVDGEQCRFVRSDFLYTDRDLRRCCTNPAEPECPEALRNGYTTSDCDGAMRALCVRDPGNALCLQWLNTRRLPALVAYADICSRELDQHHCSEFVRVTRPDFFAISDAAILRFCAEHRGNRDCWCVAPPTNRVNALETVLGPRVCWVHECTSQSTDRKYLLFEQDEQRKKCKYVGCSISVDTLLLEKSTATLVADCLHSDVSGLSEDPGTRRARRGTLPTPAAPLAILVAAVLFYFLCVYARRRVNSRVINVRRRW